MIRVINGNTNTIIGTISYVADKNGTVMDCSEQNDRSINRDFIELLFIDELKLIPASILKNCYFKIDE